MLISPVWFKHFWKLRSYCPYLYTLHWRQVLLPSRCPLFAVEEAFIQDLSPILKMAMLRSIGALWSQWVGEKWHNTAARPRDTRPQNTQPWDTRPWDTWSYDTQPRDMMRRHSFNLNCVWNQLKTVDLQGPHTYRPGILRPCCIQYTVYMVQNLPKCIIVVKWQAVDQATI